MLHLRLASPPDDFLLLSPEDPAREGSGVSLYKDTWYFCKTCGVRCFIAAGQFERTKVELTANLLAKLDVGDGILATPDRAGVFVKKVSVWKAKKEGWLEFPAPGATSYLSVNMCTLDADQEGLDLRRFHEEGWIGYYGKLKGLEGYHNEPFEGGTY